MITISALAKQFGVTTRTIERTLKKLQEDGRLSRIGQDKGGHWKVIDQPNGRDSTKDESGKR